MKNNPDSPILLSPFPDAVFAVAGAASCPCGAEVLPGGVEASFAGAAALPGGAAVLPGDAAALPGGAFWAIGGRDGEGGNGGNGRNGGVRPDRGASEAGRAPQEASGTEADSGDEGGGEPPKPKRPSWMERYVAQVLSGNILTRTEVRRMYPYVLFIAVLMFLYIANGYHIQKLHRRHDRLTEQIKELRSRSLTISSIRMTATRQSEIIKELEVRGIPLEESLTPPKIIEK